MINTENVSGHKSCQLSLVSGGDNLVSFCDFTFITSQSFCTLVVYILGGECDIFRLCLLKFHLPRLQG